MHPSCSRVENLVLPEHLQEHGVRSVARVDLCVTTTNDRMRARGWAHKAGQTEEEDVVGHGPLGHSIIWHDSVQIVKENDQSVQFEVYINNQKVAYLKRVVLSRLVETNDGSTKTTVHDMFKTNQNNSCPVSANAQPRLIVEARVCTSTPFCPPGLVPAITVFNCPEDKLVSC